MRTKAEMTASLCRRNFHQMSVSEEARKKRSSSRPPGSLAPGSKGASSTKCALRRREGISLTFVISALSEADARIEPREQEVGDQHAHDGEHRDEHEDEAGEE